MKKLSEEDMNHCEGFLTCKECEDALFATNNNKVPGSDGVSV